MKRTLDSDEEDDIEDESSDLLEVNHLPAKSQSESVPWVDKYAPKKASEICINPTKIKQLRQKLEAMSAQTCRLLILTGPSGSSKSTSVKVLSEEMKIGYVEYSNVLKFDQFMRECKFLVGNNKKIVLIEDLPNIFHKPTLESFRSIVEEWLLLDQSLPPVVLCLTEIERNFEDHNLEYFSIDNNLNPNTLLGTHIVNDQHVDVLKFNGIANKFLRQTLNMIIKKESRTFSRIPVQALNQFVDQINEVGDVRSSINNLELWARYYKKGVNLADSFTRNTTLNLFHAIGKIIYASKSFTGEQNEVNYLTVEEVLTCYENFHVLQSSVLENYLNLLPEHDLASAGYIIDYFSNSETIFNLDEGKDVLIRSARVGLSGKKSGSSFSKIRFSRHFKASRDARECSNKIRSVKQLDVFSRSSFDTVNMVDGFYIPMIMNKKRAQERKYDRVGGRFKTVDDDSLVEDEREPPPYKDQYAVEVEQHKSHDSEDEMSDPISDADEEFADDPGLDDLITQGLV